MLAIRLPVSVINGGVLMVAGFWALWSLVGQPVEVTIIDHPRKIEFTRAIVDTPVETKDWIKPDPVDPIVEPVRPTIGLVSGDVVNPIGPVTFDRVIPEIGRTDGGVDTEALPIYRADPVYSQNLINRGIEGWVRVRFTITETGAVKDAVVVAARPADVFDRSALTAIARWRYNPKIEGGVAVERVGVETVIDFQLTEEE